MNWVDQFSIEGRLQRYGTLIALSHRITLLLGKMCPRAIPLVFVTGFPKSGTSWVSQLVADYLQLPLPRLSVLPLGCASVLHGHEPPSPRLAGTVYVVRDGRDVMVSFYWAFLKRIKAVGSVSRRDRYLFPNGRAEDIRDGLPHFIDALMKRPYATRFNWPDHVRNYLNAELPATPLIRYERLLADGITEFGQAISVLTGEEISVSRLADTLNRFSFDHQARINLGGSNRRAGVAGGWKDYFTRAAAERFDEHAGEALVQLGYEEDRSWVGNIG
jgi:hypothetical protein